MADTATAMFAGVGNTVPLVGLRISMVGKFCAGMLRPHSKALTSRSERIKFERSMGLLHYAQLRGGINIRIAKSSAGGTIAAHEHCTACHNCRTAIDSIPGASGGNEQMGERDSGFGSE